MKIHKAESGFELAALSCAGKVVLAQPSPAVQTSAVDETSQSRISLSDSYDPEICTATVRNIGAKSTSKSLRLIQRDIKSNKIARRTLQTMIVFGVIGSLYYIISLVPQFQSVNAAIFGVQIQAKGETDSRQAIAYEFLSECANRKVWEICGIK